VTDLPPMPSQGQLAAGFDLARGLRQPSFRAHLAATGHVPA
jgi:hypothetical protein